MQDICNIERSTCCQRQSWTPGPVERSPRLEFTSAGLTSNADWWKRSRVDERFVKNTALETHEVICCGASCWILSLSLLSAFAKLKKVFHDNKREQPVSRAASCSVHQEQLAPSWFCTNVYDVASYCACAFDQKVKSLYGSSGTDSKWIASTQPPVYPLLLLLMCVDEKMVQHKSVAVLRVWRRLCCAPHRVALTRRNRTHHVQHMVCRARCAIPIYI